MILQDVIPEIRNYEDIGLKSFLIFVIIILGLAIYFLWKKQNKTEDAKTTMQNQFRSEILDLTEKTLALLPNYEKALTEKYENINKKTVEAITKGQDEIKTLLTRLMDK